VGYTSEYIEARTFQAAHSRRFALRRRADAGELLPVEFDTLVSLNISGAARANAKFIRREAEIVSREEVRRSQWTGAFPHAIGNDNIH
jgi:hypothetical protein